MNIPITPVLTSLINVGMSSDLILEDVENSGVNINFTDMMFDVWNMVTNGIEYFIGSVKQLKRLQRSPISY